MNVFVVGEVGWEYDDARYEPRGSKPIIAFRNKEDAEKLQMELLMGVIKYGRSEDLISYSDIGIIEFVEDNLLPDGQSFDYDFDLCGELLKDEDKLVLFVNSFKEQFFPITEIIVEM